MPVTDLAEALRQRDRVIESLTMLHRQLQTMTDDRDRFAELYEEAVNAQAFAESERDQWKAIANGI